MAHRLANRRDGLDLRVPHCRDSGLDLVNASCLEPSRNGKLFFYGKSDARRLLAITERRVVDDDGGKNLRHSCPFLTRHLTREARRPIPAPARWATSPLVLR